MSKSFLETLLADRAERLRGTPRETVAREDLIRCRQNWRRPWYNEASPENGWPPKWVRNKR